MANILICLADEKIKARVNEALATTKHKVIEGLLPDPEAALKIAIEDILNEKADVVLMDYLNDDAFSVKILQGLTDVADKPDFIFIDSKNNISREEVLMTVNEGARAILPENFSALSLVNYVERALAGPGRLRFRVKDGSSAGDTKNLEEKLGYYHSKNKLYEKLVPYLLSTPVSAQARKVLIVSDSPYQLEILKKQLGEHGFATHTAANTKDGLSIALNEKPRIIISDLELEGQTGVDFCKEVKLVHKMGPCYFVVCTANQDKINKVMTPGNGVDDCILKPSGKSDLDMLISRISLGLLL